MTDGATEATMRVGVVGSGNVGGALGLTLAAAGHEVLFSFSRREAKLRALAARAGAGARAGTPADAAAFGDVILFAPAWPAVDEALAQATRADHVALADKVLVDCTNPWGPVRDAASGGESVARRAAGARVVKAYNTVAAPVLARPSKTFGGRPAAGFYCGDDADAKRVAARLVADSGLEPVDAGPLASARALEAMVPLYFEIARRLGGAACAYALARDPSPRDPSASASRAPGVAAS